MTPQAHILDLNARGWEPRAVKRVAKKIGSGKTPTGGVTAYVSAGIVFVRSQNVYDDGLRLEDVAFIDDATDREMAGTRVRPGDVLLNITGASLGRCSVVPQRFPRANVNQHVCIIRPAATVHPAYLSYALRASTTKAQIWAGENGSSREGLNFQQVGNLVVGLPPGGVEQQRTIADFLDRKTTAIDDLIAKKERLAELFHEKRHVAIWTAVTKGVASGTRLREAGHQWLGRVPSHWDIARTRQVARLESGHTPSRQHPEYWIPEECTIPWVSLADVWQIREGRVDVIRETAEKVSPLGVANSAARVLPAGTVIVSRTASVGFSAMIAEPMATTQDFVNWICGPRLRPRFLLYVFRAMRDEFKRLTMGSTHQTIYMPDVARFVTPVPPLAEQDAIVDEIAKRLLSLDALAAALAGQIERLREYRQALITAAVTGQVDVTKERAA